MARAQERREGRGHLSSIDLLLRDERMLPAVMWANKQLDLRRLPANVILVEFNERILDIDPGTKPISKSAFNRHAIKLAIEHRKTSEINGIAAALGERRDPAAPDHLTMMIAELTKITIYHLLGKRDDFTMKEIMEATRALKEAAAAENVSLTRRERHQKIVDDACKELAGKVDEIGKKKGVSPEALAAINRALMGQS